MFFQHNNRCGRLSFPLRRKIAIATGGLVKRNPLLTRKVRLCLMLPEVEAVTLWNPAGGCAHISHDELNKASSEELSDIFVR
jgi:hypothetical protein